MYALLRVALDTTGFGEERQLDVETNSSAENVYITLAESWIRHYGSLEILQGIKGTSDGYCLLSWGPDWSNMSDRPSLFNRYEGLHASPSQQAQCEFSNNGRILHIHGIPLDNISAVSSCAWDDLQQGDDILREISRQCREWLAMTKKLEPNPGEQSISLAWCRTVTGDWAGFQSFLQFVPSQLHLTKEPFYMGLAETKHHK